MDRDNVFQAQLAEHMSARDELLGAINNQHMALTFGTGALVAVFGAGFVVWSQTIAPAVFLGIVPLSWWILAMWLGEVVRMLRAVEFCTGQEEIINQSIQASTSSVSLPLRWEKWRQDERAPWRTITWTYLSVGILLAVTNIAALACYTVTAFQRHWSAWIIGAIWVLVSILGGMVAWQVLSTFQRWGVTEVGMPQTPIINFFEKIRVLGRGDRQSGTIHQGGPQDLE